MTTNIAANTSSLFYSHQNFPHERIVAFVDILGFSQLVREMKINLHVYRRLLGLLEEMERRALNPFSKDIVCSLFSDSMVCSVKHTENGSIHDIGILLKMMARMNGILLEYGILTRGGISVGWAYHEKNIMLGEGILNAYMLESKKAVTPRIILDAKLNHLVYPFVSSNVIDLDTDGYYYLNLFNELRTWYEEPMEIHDTKWMEQVKSNIETSLGLNNIDYKVYEKLVWLAEKFNIELNKPHLSRVKEKIGRIDLHSTCME